MKVEADIWDMKHGRVIVLKYNSCYYHLNSPHKPRGYKEQYLLKWIRQNNIEVFTLDEFFKAYPKRKQKKHEALDLISSEIKAKRMLQLGNEKFKVIKDVS